MAIDKIALKRRWWHLATAAILVLAVTSAHWWTPRGAAPAVACPRADARKTPRWPSPVRVPTWLIRPTRRIQAVVHGRTTADEIRRPLTAASGGRGGGEAFQGEVFTRIYGPDRERFGAARRKPVTLYMETGCVTTRATEAAWLAGFSAVANGTRCARAGGSAGLGVVARRRSWFEETLGSPGHRSFIRLGPVAWTDEGAGDIL